MSAGKRWHQSRYEQKSTAWFSITETEATVANGLRLNTGELWVILNELNLGGGLLGAEGALVAHSDPDRTAMLRDGRATLLARGLLRVNGEGRLALAEGPRALIARSAHPDAAVWLMRTSGAGAPAQVYVALNPDGGVAYRPDASGVHDFIPIPDANTLSALTQMEMSALPECPGLRPRVWLAPTAVLGPVAEGTETGDGDNSCVNALVGCGFSAADAEAFVAAVAEAELRR